MSKKNKEPQKPQESQEPSGDSRELGELQAENEELSRRILRLQADMDNLRRRTAREKDEWWQLATSDFLMQLLPVLDNFERALGSFPRDQSGEWGQGVSMVFRQLQAIMQKAGLEEICNEGYFDPQCHEAIMQDNDAAVAENVITAVFEKGYSHKGRLLRPSKVKVSIGGKNNE